MGLVIDSLKQSLKIIQDNKIIFAITWVYVLVFNTDIIFNELNLSKSLFSFIVFPLFAGGIFGMICEATERPTKLSTFAEAGEKNYVKLFIASALFLAITSLNMKPNLTNRVFLEFVSRFDPSQSSLMVFYRLIIVLGAIGLIFFFLFQFYAIGIVAYGYGILETFKKSYEFTRKRLKAVLYYSIFRVVIETIGGGIVPIFIFYYNKGRLWNPTSFYDRHPDPTTFQIPIDLNLEHILINLTLSLLIAFSFALVLTFTAVFYVRSQNPSD